MPDDPHVNPEGSFMLAAETLVKRLVKADRARKWQVRILGIVCAGLAALAVIYGIGYNQLKSYTDQKVRSECMALELLTQKPVAKPVNPKANPSREATYRFYLALVYWERRDDCRAITVTSNNS